MKDVFISVKGYQAQPDGSNKDCIELVTEGQYSFSIANTEFSYKESEATGFNGCITSFSITPDRVVMSRVGSLSGDMIFAENERHEFEYCTEAGKLDLGVRTLEINNSLDESGGELEINYLLDYNNKVFSRNSFLIRI